MDEVGEGSGGGQDGVFAKESITAFLFFYKSWESDPKVCVCARERMCEGDRCFCEREIDRMTGRQREQEAGRECREQRAECFGVSVLLAQLLNSISDSA